MKTRRLGRDGPEFSVVGFGAWEAGGKGWGTNPPDEQVIRAVHAAIDTGINWIDTAEIYGSGASEKLVGRALSGRRDEMMIATKVAPRPDGTGFSTKQVRAACEKSLKRLGVGVIDLYQLHWSDDEIPVEETWEAMASLVDDGLVKWIGVSNFGKKRMLRCEAIRHVTSLQAPGSILDVEQRSLMAWCGEQGIGVVPYSPLACAMLTGAVDASTEFPGTDFRSGKLWDSGLYARFFAPEKLGGSLAVVDGLRPVATRLGCTLAQLALAWLLAQPGVTSPIAGTRDPEHIVEDAGASDVQLDQAALDEIERLIPAGPAFV